MVVDADQACEERRPCAEHGSDGSVVAFCEKVIFMGWFKRLISDTLVALQLEGIRPNHFPMWISGIRHRAFQVD
jgi:hypothetical protein